MRLLPLIVVLIAAAPIRAEQDHGASAQGVTGIDVWSQGAALHVLVGRSIGKGVMLEHVSSADGGESWSAPAAVGEGQPAPYRAEAGDIQISGQGGALLAMWTSKGPGPMGSGPLAAAFSDDNGRTWRAAPAPGSGGHGRRFSDLAAGSGFWHAIWLDRLKNSQLRHSRWDGKAKAWEPERTIDDEVCECCWNTAAFAGETLAALYRDKDPRDMALSTSADGGKTWGSPVRPGDFDWRFNGCPHVGGAVAASGSAWHVLTWTGRGGQQGLYHMSDADKWKEARRLGGQQARFSDLAAAADGTLAAVWSEPAKKIQVVYESRSSDGGKTWSAPARLSPEGVSCTHPRVAPVAGGFRAFWIEKRDNQRSWSSARL